MESDPLHLTARDVYRALFAVVHGPGRRRDGRAAADPNAARATYSPDGQRIAYNPIAGRYQQWKDYRGGTVQRLWLYNTKGHAIEKIPQPAERSNDTDPMWIGDTVFFRSDRAGEFNLFAYRREDEARAAGYVPHRFSRAQRRLWRWAHRL